MEKEKDTDFNAPMRVLLDHMAKYAEYIDGEDDFLEENNPHWIVE